jgi:hypothetical protein
MPAEFVVHDVAHDSLRDWRRRMRNRRGGGQLVQAYFEYLEAELIRTDGRPAGAEVIEWLRPEINVWEFQYQETWVVYTIQRRGSWWARVIGRQELRVVLLRMFAHPPLRAELELLARAVRSRG